MQILVLDPDGVLHGPFSGTFTAATTNIGSLFKADNYELPDGSHVGPDTYIVYGPVTPERAKDVIASRRMATDSPVMKANLRVGDFFFAYAVHDGRIFDTGFLVIATPEERPLRLVTT